MNLQIQALNLAYAALANTDTEQGTAQFELEAEALAAILEAREQPTTVESSAVQRSPIKPVVDPDLDANQRLAFKLGWKSAEEAHNIK